MNTTTRRAATLTAALMIAGTLAACGGEPEAPAEPVASSSPMTDEEKWAAADAEKQAAMESTIAACVESDQADPEMSAEATLGISSEQFCKESRADDPINFDIWYGPGTDAEKMQALEEHANKILEEDE